MSVQQLSRADLADLARRCADRTVAYAEARRATRRNRQYRTLEVRAWARVWWLVCDVCRMPSPPTLMPAQEIHHVPERLLCAALVACGMTEDEAQRYARESRTVSDMLCPAARNRKHGVSRARWARIAADPVALDAERKRRREAKRRREGVNMEFLAAFPRAVLS